MSYETIVVAFEDTERADAAVDALRDLGLPPAAIRRHPVSAPPRPGAPPQPVPSQPGFWSWLFGHDAERALIRPYQHALARGGTILSISVLEEESDRVRTLLDEFGPLDLAETTALA